MYMTLEDYVKKQEEKAKASYEAGKENVKEAVHGAADKVKDATN